MTRIPMQPNDLPATAALCRQTLAPWIDRDWSVPAGDLEWTCRRTLDHIIDTQLFLGGNAAMRSTSRVLPIRNGDPSATVEQLLSAVVTAAMLLERVCAGMGPGGRGFHPAGQADAEGFRAQGCAEILQHTWDIANGLGEGFRAPEDLSGRIVARLFPWTPTADEHPDRWEVLLWSVGRIALPKRERLDSNWWVQMAPLEEWDGQRKVRTMSPAWR
ncbi:MAG TPA: hypothetical protein VGR22_02430 [Thermomicrobiales bacterium]|nr:hypothetical protein [Thermomicrobiales bacterium]